MKNLKIYSPNTVEDSVELYLFVNRLRSTWLPNINHWRWFLFIGLWLQGAIQNASGQNDLLQQHIANGTVALTVDMKGNLLSIDAKQASWQSLLSEIEEKAHIPIHCAIPLKEPVTVSISAVPVKDALESLFGPGADFVFQFSNMTSQPYVMPREVWVLGHYIGFDTQTKQSISGNIKKGLNPTLAGSNTLSEGERFELETVDQLVEKARSAKNPESRVLALASLSGHEEIDEEAAKLALDAAFNDKDPSVREYAVQAFASQDGAEAAEYLRQALQDTDSSVRIKAIENMSLKHQGIDLLQEALSNSDQLVQAIASDRLKQLTQ